MNISDRINELMLSYRREARRCLRGKAYLAATVMQVAAFEAGLQAVCFLYPEEVKRTTVYAGMFGPAHGVRRVHIDDLADDEPVKEHTYRCQCCFIVGLAKPSRRFST
jgi:hypothetical protein